MKKFTAFLVLVFHINSLLAQTWQSNCIATPDMQNIFRNDVVKTATFRLLQTGSVYKDSIDIPLPFKDSIAKAFYAIYNMPSTPVKDTIMNLFGFINFYPSGGYFFYETDSLHINNNGYSLAFNSNKSPKSLDMYISDTTTWANQWHAGNYTSTSNAQVNFLAQKYGINVADFYTGLPGFFHIVARTNMAVNTIALAKAFNAITLDPQSCNQGYYVGDGNSIELEYQTNGIIVHYSNRCGDCLVACDYGHAWSFFVNSNDCSVQYLGAQNLGVSYTGVYTCTRGPVLPLNWGKISASIENESALIKWQVFSEMNVKNYVVERSEDGKHFYSIGQLAAKANNVFTSNYFWQDNLPIYGQVFYRIMSMDLDGKINYSEVVFLTKNANVPSVNIFPNPIKNHIAILHFTKPQVGKMDIIVFNFMGEQVWNTSISTHGQSILQSLNLPTKITAGNYLFVCTQGNQILKQTIIVL